VNAKLSPPPIFFWVVKGKKDLGNSKILVIVPLSPKCGGNKVFLGLMALLVFLDCLD